MIDGTVAYLLGNLSGVDGITSGRNNMFAIYRSGLTKLRNNTALHMSIGVVDKGFISCFVGSFAMDVYYGIKQFSYERIKNGILK